jgi:hypothetical protein
MAHVVINNKTYEIPQFTFGEIRQLEDYGCPIMNLADAQNHLFGTLAAFVAVTAGVDMKEADRLLTQHVMGGGDITEPFITFVNALQESAFFMKMVEMAGKNPQTAKKTAKKAE